MTNGGPVASEQFARREGGQDWYRPLSATTQTFPVPVALIPHLVSMGAGASPSPWGATLLGN